MIRRPIRSLSRVTVAVLAVLALAACGGQVDSDSVTPSATAAGSYLLEADFTEAGNVFAARKKGAGDEVTVFGRVRSELDGSASFTIIDTSIDFCGEGLDKCSCPTPWDYCCEEQKTLVDASLPVEIRDAKGEVIDVEKHDLRLLDLVALKGTLTENESGGVFLIVEDGWFRRERPEIKGEVDWPE